MFKSPSFQFLFAGLSLPQQLISLMSFLNSWLLENCVSAWKPVLSKGEGLGTLCPDAAPPSLSPCTPAPPHPHPPPQAPTPGEVVPPSHSGAPALSLYHCRRPQAPHTVSRVLSLPRTCLVWRRQPHCELKTHHRTTAKRSWFLWREGVRRAPSSHTRPSRHSVSLFPGEH